MCGCTDHSHKAVREAIVAQHLTTKEAVFKALEWKTPNGCDKCRPAVNYYLISSWPHEAKDDPQSRFINERAHANIQKDGTYSVVPRMWGGLTTPNELRAIADAAEKYKVPTVKVTGGQRIDLLGVKKEDLPKMWADLNAAGMVSGHAYGKSIRTVKTCVGAEHCRFGTQKSMDMGVKLEKMLFDMYAPHKVKLAVSGCPRNCAEAGIKDVGVIGVDSGYELYIGGNGGIKTEVAQFLCKVRSDEEVMEYSGAFLQLYREEGWYLERTCHYMERVGLDYIKGKISRTRKAARLYYQRLLDSLKDAKDPWQTSREEADQAIHPKQFSRIGRSKPLSHSRKGNNMSNWKLICKLEDIPQLGSRVVQRRQAAATSPSSAPRRRGLRAARQMPAQGRPAVAGHRPWQARDLPAARLEHRPRRRPGRRAGCRRTAARSSKSRSRTATSSWPPERPPQTHQQGRQRSRPGQPQWWGSGSRS
jgi:dissimilatory sulfite reductase (desulfoviridin) alpha/beta subunit